MAKWSPKDPDDVRDYWLDVTGLLSEGETVNAATVTVPDGITKDADDFTDTMVRVRVSGGVAGSYDIEFLTTTSSGEVFGITKTLTVKERKF